MHPILIIVFGPLLAAIVAGLGNRMLGNVVAKSLTTGALFLSAVLSWPIFLAFIAGDAEATVVPVLRWVENPRARRETLTVSPLYQDSASLTR